MKAPVEYQPPEPLSNPRIVLESLGRKIGAGRELTLGEQLMASTATAQETANGYGPTPENMQLSKPELPETVKGVLANYIS